MTRAAAGEKCPRRSFGFRVFLLVAVAVLFWSLVGPAAQAASYRYANDVVTPNGQARYSGLRAQLNGGKIEANVWVGTVVVISYNPAPGYVQHGSASAHKQVTLSHSMRTNAYSRCYWTIPGSGGEARLSCWAHY